MKTGPNKTARGSGHTAASIAATNKRSSENEMVQDMERFQRGEMTAEAFKAKWQPKEGDLR